jgi:hypothetical protein
LIIKKHNILGIKFLETPGRRKTKLLSSLVSLRRVFIRGIAILGFTRSVETQIRLRIASVRLYLLLLHKNLHRRRRSGCVIGLRSTFKIINCISTNNIYNIMLFLVKCGELTWALEERLGCQFPPTECVDYSLAVRQKSELLCPFQHTQNFRRLIGRLHVCRECFLSVLLRFFQFSRRQCPK